MSRTASSLDINTFMVTLYIIVFMLHILLVAKTNYHTVINNNNNNVKLLNVPQNNYKKVRYRSLLGYPATN